MLMHAAFADGSEAFTGSVILVSEDHGNIDTDISRDTLQAKGISKGDTLRVSFGDQQFSVPLAETYGDVDKGEWVAFINWEEKLRIARNADNAARTLGVSEGDQIGLQKQVTPAAMPE